MGMSIGTVIMEGRLEYISKPRIHDDIWIYPRVAQRFSYKAFIKLLFVECENV